MALEIERKFLLKELPRVKWNSVCEIEQYYCQNPKVRIRYSYNVETKEQLFIQTIKKQLKPGVYEEDEKFLSAKKFFTLQTKANKMIKKTRYVKVLPKVKWEVDKFENVHLIVAEVEMVSENYRLKIPKFIQNVLIKEVTDFPEFTNHSLASSFSYLVTQ